MCSFYRRHIYNLTYSSALLTDLIKKTKGWRSTVKKEAFKHTRHTAEG